MSSFPCSFKLLEIPEPKYSDTVFNKSPERVGPFIDVVEIISPIITKDGSQEYIVSIEVGECFLLNLNSTLELKSTGSYSLSASEILFKKSVRTESIDALVEIMNHMWDQYLVFRKRFFSAVPNSSTRELITLTEDDFIAFATTVINRTV